jgi:hypothetical protein
MLLHIVFESWPQGELRSLWINVRDDPGNSNSNFAVKIQKMVVKHHY